LLEKVEKQYKLKESENRFVKFCLLTSNPIKPGTDWVTFGARAVLMKRAPTQFKIIFSFEKKKSFSLKVSI